MARSIERIERDIAGLEEAIADLAAELHSLYGRYLKDLGQAVRQQLILATYHVCTHGYPDAFLKLSVSQQQQLQRSIRQLAQQAQGQLLASLSLPEKMPEVVEEVADENATKNPDPISFLFAETSPPESENQGENISENTPESEPENPPETEPEKLIDSGEETLKPLAEAIKKPEDLADWQEEQEIQIIKILQNLSRNINRVLQEFEILPQKFPERVLDIAAKAEASGETVAGPPNLLNLLVETETSEDQPGLRSQPMIPIQVMTIHLRLSEIEFSDSVVMSERSQIRSLAAKLSKIGRDYQKKQRDKSIAQAESAWRSSWFEE